MKSYQIKSNQAIRSVPILIFALQTQSDYTKLRMPQGLSLNVSLFRVPSLDITDCFVLNSHYSYDILLDFYLKISCKKKH